MWNGRTISVILPAYNEAPGIRRAVEEFSSVEIVDEVVVVDNNSTDGTHEEVALSGARLVQERRQGFGYALQRGLREAKGNLLVLAEPDGTFMARDIFKLVAYAEDFDLVCGTRTTRELIWQKANMGWLLRFGNVAVAKLLELLHGGPSLSDCGCTFRAIRREALDRIQEQFTVGGSHFLPEMTILALQAGLRVIEIPVNYRSRVGESKITGSLKGMVVTGTRMIWLILHRRLTPGRPCRARRARQEERPDVRVP